MAEHESRKQEAAAVASEAMSQSSTDIRRRLARRVRYLRSQRRWTQEALAERAALTGKYIGQIERGEVYPSLRVLEQLARAVGVPLHELLDWSDEHHGTTPERLYARLSSQEVNQIRGALTVLQLLFTEPVTSEKRRGIEPRPPAEPARRRDRSGSKDR